MLTCFKLHASTSKKLWHACLRQHHWLPMPILPFLHASNKSGISVDACAYLCMPQACEAKVREELLQARVAPLRRAEEATAQKATVSQAAQEAAYRSRYNTDAML